MSATAHTYLSEMPDAPCPPGCVVRKGDVLGSVTCNPGNGCWTVTILNDWHGRACEGSEQNDSCPTPEAAGWRHALDQEAGLSYAWLRIQSFFYGGSPEDCARVTDALGSPDWPAMKVRRWRGETTDADLLLVARAFAAVLR